MADQQRMPAGAAGLTLPAVGFLDDLAFEPAVAGVLLALVLWLAWRRPTLVLMIALASLALRPQLLWGGPAIGYDWGLHHTLIVLGLAANALRHGIRLQGGWPILALLATFVLLSPIFGRGFGAGLIAASDSIRAPLTTPHNEYVHLLVIGGVVGFVLIAGAIVMWYRQILHVASPNDSPFLLALAAAL